MRRTGDLLAATGNLPVFVFDVPATWQGSAPRRYYESELRRLGAFLVRLGGRRLTDEDIHSLINASAAAAERRRASVTTHSNAPCLEDSSCGSEAALSSGQGRSGLSRCRVPVAIAGGPLGASERLLVNMIDSAGGRVALDATESGERTLPVFSRLRKAEERPETILADAYFGSIPDIFARPDSRFHDWMERMTRERGIRGVIVFVHLWCDRWRAEVQTLRDRLPLPVLLVSSGNELASEHVWARIEAFLEVVR
jgi:benzoyl-CoA reductase/2-hydroxyglutaryl-CoA dehydratase subunit BcrC/BadD/HgdB